MPTYKYSNRFQTSFPDEISILIRKESNRLNVSLHDVLRIAVDKYFQQLEQNNPETNNEKTNNGNEQSERNDGKREHLYF
jgi:hypothetical protein